jgi:hypothetical protein
MGTVSASHTLLRLTHWGPGDSSNLKSFDDFRPVGQLNNGPLRTDRILLTSKDEW